MITMTSQLLDVVLRRLWAAKDAADAAWAAAQADKENEELMMRWSRLDRRLRRLWLTAMGDMNAEI